MSLITQIKQQSSALDAPAVPQWDAAVMLAISDSSTPRITFLKRAAHLSSHAGEVAFPGGMRDEDDYNPQYTALRETEEEIGLGPEQIEILGVLPRHRSRQNLNVIPIIGLVPDGLNPQPCSEESDQVFSVPVDFFTDQQPHRVHRLSRPPNSVYCPAWDWEDHEIWGLSAMILVSFLRHTGLQDFDLKTPQPGIPVIQP